MTAESDRAWFGPLSMAPASVTQRIEAVPAFESLKSRGLKADETLIYAPVLEPTAPDVVVIGRMFAWDDKSPVIWVFSTIGLSRVEQPVRDDRPAFRHFELAIATNNAEKEDPFPMRIGAVLSQGATSFPGWDWNHVKHPPLVQWLASAGQSIAGMVQAGSQFAIGDTLTIGPGSSAWTRSALNHSMLLPATPHMLLLGLAPFDRPADPANTVEVGEWHSRPGAEAYLDHAVG